MLPGWRGWLKPNACRPLVVCWPISPGNTIGSRTGSSERSPQPPDQPDRRSAQIDPDRHRRGGDDRGVAAVIVGDIKTALDRLHGDLAMRQRRFYHRDIDPVRLLHPNRHFDLHRPGIDAEGANEAQRAVVDRIRDRADRRLGVIAAMQIVAGAEFGDDALHCHLCASGMSRRTTAAALATTVLPVPASLAISRPPSTTRTVPLPCGNTARTASVSTRSGRGTPIVTSTCIASTGRPTASATLSELCHKASRSARTAALV